MLRAIPMDKADPVTDRDPRNDSFSMADLSLGESGSANLGKEFRGSFINIIREQARQYLNSFPGNEASAGNSHHVHFRKLVRSEEYDKEFYHDEFLEFLSNILCFRIAVTQLATEYKKYLDLSFPDCHLMDTWVWEQKYLESCGNNAEGWEKWMRYSRVRNAVFDSNVFPHPARNQGWSFPKPIDYLAIAFYESNRPAAQVKAELEKLVKCK